MLSGQQSVHVEPQVGDSALEVSHALLKRCGARSERASRKATGNACEHGRYCDDGPRRSERDAWLDRLRLFFLDERGGLLGLFLLPLVPLVFVEHRDEPVNHAKDRGRTEGNKNEFRFHATSVTHSLSQGWP